MFCVHACTGHELTGTSSVNATLVSVDTPSASNGSTSSTVGMYLYGVKCGMYMCVYPHECACLCVLHEPKTLRNNSIYYTLVECNVKNVSSKSTGKRGAFISVK